MLAAERGAPCCWQPCAAVPSGAWLRWSACSGLRGRRRCVKLSDFGARRCRWNSASRRSREPLGAQRGVRSARWGARAPRPGPAERGRARGAAARAGEPPGSARAGRVLACTCWEGCRCVCFADLCMQKVCNPMYATTAKIRLGHTCLWGVAQRCPAAANPSVPRHPRTSMTTRRTRSVRPAERGTPCCPSWRPWRRPRAGWACPARVAPGRPRPRPRCGARPPCRSLPRCWRARSWAPPWRRCSRRAPAMQGGRQGRFPGRGCWPQPHAP